MSSVLTALWGRAAPWLAAVAAALGALALAFGRGRREGAALERDKRAADVARQNEELRHAQDRMLDAAGRRPSGRDELAGRLRDGTF